MHRYGYFSAVVLGLSLPVSLYAAKPISFNGSDIKGLGNHYHIQLSQNSKSFLGLKASENNLSFLNERTDKDGVSHIRLQQKYKGFPVFGGYIILHTAKSGTQGFANNKKVKANGRVYHNLQHEIGTPPADFSKNANKALDILKGRYNKEVLSEAQVEPMIYVDNDNIAHWAYKASVLVEHQDKIPERPVVIFSSNDFSELFAWNDIKTLKNKVRGVGFGGNEKGRKYEFGRDLPYLHIERDDDRGYCYMENATTRIVDMKHRTSKPNTAIKFPCVFNDPNRNSANVYYTGYKNDGYDMENGAYSPANDALYIGYVLDKMYGKWYDLPPLSKDDKALKMIMRVHYGNSYQNAFWDGKQMTFGDGGDDLYPLVSLGVGAHEISHGFTEQHSNLLYFGQSGGINESFSDMAAQAAEYYTKRRSSWKLGGEVLKDNTPGVALRYMKKPSEDGMSIDSADQYKPGLNVHFSSGVYNRLFYLMAHNKGWNTRKAFDVMVKANMDYWTPYSNFEEAGCGVLSATEELGYDVDQVKSSLDEVAISYEQCGADIDSDDEYAENDDPMVKNA